MTVNAQTQLGNIAIGATALMLDGTVVMVMSNNVVTPPSGSVNTVNLANGDLLQFPASTIVYKVTYVADPL